MKRFSARRLNIWFHETPQNFEVLYENPGATFDDLREAVTTFEDLARTARRVLGAAHPLASGIEEDLQDARDVLAAHETQPPSGSA